MINREDIKKLIEAHGVEETLDICFEECGELVQAISKVKRAMRSGKGINDAQTELMKEISDVHICLEMLMEVFSISDSALKMYTDAKMKRNLKRINEC